MLGSATLDTGREHWGSWRLGGMDTKGQLHVPGMAASARSMVSRDPCHNCVRAYTIPIL